ncbi:MAG: PhoH family protein, partial [Betaproteobacteria bacterium]
MRRTASRKALHFAADADNSALANLTGALDANLRQIETELEVEIRRRGHQFRIEGEPSHAQQAIAVIEHFLARASRPISVDDIQLYFVELRGRGAQASPAPTADRLPELHTRRRDLHGRTPRQRDYIEAILAHDIGFGIGPAGTGKTYLAVACAVDALERSAVERIVLTRPAVEAGERLGFLPGDLKEKVDPYLRPLYDALHDMLPPDLVAKRLTSGEIEVAPLAFMRGRTLAHAFAILDEAQNTTPMQMKMFLTRLGEGSRMVVTGDLTQIDLPQGQKSGLAEALDTLEGVQGIGVTRFTGQDVV